MTAPDDAKDVLSALRLGWYFAEMRGRNRPGGPPGEMIGMPDRVNHPLPLRIERSLTELRIGAQSVVAALAKQLNVDESADGASFTAALNDKAELLSHLRAPTAAGALRRALHLLEQQPADVQAGDVTGAASALEQALEVLQRGLADQEAVVLHQRSRAAAAARRPDQAQAAAESAPAAAETVVQLELACRDAETAGAAALEQVISVLKQAVAASPDTAAQAGIDCIRQCQQAIADAAYQPWADLAELIWRFDAHVQDRLTAISESQAIGYQLGRGLAETYWALDPVEPYGLGATSWGFLLGVRRCDELSQLTGQLAAYMNEYTAPAIAGSLQVWKAAVLTPAWLGHPNRAAVSLYNQVRRWHELIILERDPTALISPYMRLRNLYVARRAMRFFSGRLILAAFGVAGLIALIIYLGTGTGSVIVNTLLAIVAAAGFSAVGLSARRFTREVNIDLVTIAVQTAPPPPDKNTLLQVISRRHG